MIFHENNHDKKIHNKIPLAFLAWNKISSKIYFTTKYIYILHVTYSTFNSSLLSTLNILSNKFNNNSSNETVDLNTGIACIWSNSFKHGSLSIHYLDLVSLRTWHSSHHLHMTNKSPICHSMHDFSFFFFFFFFPLLFFNQRWKYR